MQPTLKELAVAELREPTVAMRTEMDDDKLRELAQSIEQIGQLQPIAVYPHPEGGHEIGYGHRRYRAFRLLGRAKIRAFVYKDREHMLAARDHENSMREEVSPADEATFYAALYDEEGDVDKVAARVKRPRQHVENRLALIRGWPDVFAALQAGNISVGVALEFNRLQHEEDAAFYLEWAVRSGCTVNTARQWVQDAKLRRQLQQTPPIVAAAEGNGGPAPLPASLPGTIYSSIARPFQLTGSSEVVCCEFCGMQDQAFKLFRVFSCGTCADSILVALRRRLDEGA